MILAFRLIPYHNISDKHFSSDNHFEIFGLGELEVYNLFKGAYSKVLDLKVHTQRSLRKRELTSANYKFDLDLYDHILLRNF